MPSATDSAVRTSKPRVSMARASRVRKGLSSSTRSSARVVRPAVSVVDLMRRFSLTCRGSFIAPQGPRLVAASSRWAARCRSSSRGQSIRTMAPCSGRRRLASETRAPERSSRVLAMKKPRPMPPWRSPVAVARRRRAAPRGDKGLAEPVDTSSGQTRPVIAIVTATSVCRTSCASTSTRSSAKSTAFSTRLPRP